MLIKQKLHSMKKVIDALRDVRVIGFIGFVVIIAMVTLDGVRVLQQNFQLQKQIAQLEQEIAIQELENANLALRNQYYETDQYLELQARRQFGLAAPGETVLLVPEQVVLANSVAEPEDEVLSLPDGLDERPEYLRNIDEWREFFFRGMPWRGDADD